MMEKYFEKWTKVITFVTLIICISFYPSKAFAVCTCDGYSGAFIGMEMLAQECPPENADDNTQYVYIVRAISCMSGEVKLFSPWGDNLATPSYLEGYLSSQGLRVFRNAAGTHFIAVHKNYKNNLNGLLMANFPGGAVYQEAAMTEICVAESPDLADNDEDGVPVCLDCNDNDPLIGGGIEDFDGDGVPACYDCDDSNNLKKAGKGFDLDGDGYVSTLPS